MWSTVPIVRSGNRTRQPRARSMSNACGVVTSWMRCNPTNSCVCPLGSFRTVWASHTFCNNVCDMDRVDSTTSPRLAARGSRLGDTRKQGARLGDWDDAGNGWSSDCDLHVGSRCKSIRYEDRL